jgi:hypothetical protein
MSMKPYIKSGRMGIKSFSIVGWTYEADTYCNSCAEEMGITNDKSREEMGEEDGFPIFADSEWDYQPHCGNCGDKIPYVTVLDYEE